jgi:hypothetical protein
LAILETRSEPFAGAVCRRYAVRVEAASTVFLLASRVKIPAGLGGPSLRPMMWTFLAILVTFLLTRTVTRLIRSGSGARAGLGNARIGGHHVHHQVFGILIIIGTSIVLVSEMPRGRRSTPRTTNRLRRGSASGRAAAATIARARRSAETRMSWGWIILVTTVRAR